jgi:hypothetical protein
MVYIEGGRCSCPSVGGSEDPVLAPLGPFPAFLTAPVELSAIQITPNLNQSINPNLPI